MTFATWGQLESHVPHFHPQQWSHMFVKMCMLCAFSGPICSHAFSPMSPALPGGLSRSLTLFIQTEQLGPSQPKQWGMGREIIMETSGLTKRLKFLSVPFFFYSPVFLSVICLSPLGVLSGHVGSCSAQVSWTAGQTSLTCFVSCLSSHIKSSFSSTFSFLFIFTLQLMFFL